MIPSFPIQGGKARIREWLLCYFPKFGSKYIELFAGRGNVFFAAVKNLNFNNYELSDLDASFLQAMKIVNLTDLPTTANDFDFWRSDDSPIAKILEPVLSFKGKGYAAGKQIDRYNYFDYRDRCLEAKRLLQNVKVESRHWELFDFTNLTRHDFIYLDPPYYNTENFYGQIDHISLVKILNNLPCLWALSGYENPIYTRLNFKRKAVCTRQLEMRNTLNGTKQRVEETLWMNY